MPYWIEETLLVTPAFLWVYVLLGVPLALAILPRDDWQDRLLVLTTGFALGSGALTVIMFAMGSTKQPLLTRENVVIVLSIFTVAAFALAYWKNRQTQPNPLLAREPFAIDEITLITLLVIAIIIRWVVVAFWSFTAYDALWVYGYEGRLYFLEGLIPAKIDYYPQFLPLQYTFGQLIYGQISDSAARAVLPFLHVGSVLAAYLLGARNFNRRTGIYLAALWGLYPAVAEWSRMGDLEIPLAFLLTLSATFFLMAWNGKNSRHYAIIAGLIYGLALWTKPTAGAFALGIIFINGIELIRTRFQWKMYRHRFEVSLLVALMSAPIGGMWYIRNLLLAHEAVTFPPSYWYSLAERGGGQLIWVLIGLAILIAFLYTRQNNLLNKNFINSGFGLMLIGSVPSIMARWIPVAPNSPILYLFPSLEGLPRLGWFEWALILIGGVIIARELLKYAKNNLTGIPLAEGSNIGWMLAVALPYFIVYFWRYSYHYRLSFAIIPLLALPIAVILANWLPENIIKIGRGYVIAGSFILLSIPGIVYPFYDVNLGWDYLWDEQLVDDTAKLTSGNEALMWMVDGFQIYERENGKTPIVIAPGVQRLPFFFPQADIRIHEAPTQLSDLEGVTYFVDSHPDGTGKYEDIPILDNQVLSALGRNDIMRKAWWKDDGIFRYEIYELHLENRVNPQQPHALEEDEIVFGEFVRLVGHEISSTVFPIGQRRTFKLFWEVLEAPTEDYMTYIHLRDGDGNLQMAWDGAVGVTDNGRYYTTLVWEPGESIIDERTIRLTKSEIPLGEDYSVVIGMYNLATGERVRIAKNGDDIGDGYQLIEGIIVIPAAD